MTSAADTTLADLGEFAMISALLQRFEQGGEQGEQVLLGPGDDAAVVAAPDGRVVVSTDLLVDTRHFRRDWASATDIGHKAAAQNLSDINAMGGVASALTVGLAAPGDLPVAWALELAEGIAAEAALVGAAVVGGDLTRAEEIMVAVTVLGSCEADPVRRSGARPGDVLAICGRQGWAAAGLAVLARGFRSPRVLVEAHRRPAPPYAAGPEAAALGATAMIDVSDGLLADIGHLAEGSEVSIDVDPTAFQVAEPLRAVGSALGADPMSFILTGGDDYALAATFPAGTWLPQGWQVIGEVLEPSGTERVTVGGSAYDGPSGHEHFR